MEASDARTRRRPVLGEGLSTVEIMLYSVGPAWPVEQVEIAWTQTLLKACGKAASAFLHICSFKKQMEPRPLCSPWIVVFSFMYA